MDKNAEENEHKLETYPQPTQNNPQAQESEDKIKSGRIFEKLKSGKEQKTRADDLSTYSDT